MSSSAEVLIACPDTCTVGIYIPVPTPSTAETRGPRINFSICAMFSLRRIPTVARQSVRTYAAATNDGKPPIQLFGVDGTYASALYSASAKAGSLDAVSSALNRLQGTLKSDPKVAGLISNPTLSNADKAVVVDVLSKSIGNEKSVTNLLKVMSENNRLGLLPQVSEAFTSLISAQNGEVEVTITSAQVYIYHGP